MTLETFTTKMNSQTYLQRKPKSDLAKLFVRVLSRDKNGKPKSGIVPGSEAKLYHVIRRNLSIKNGATSKLITLECRLDCGHSGHKNCEGNTHSGVICYHSRAFLDKCISEVNMQSYWHTSPDKAKSSHRMHGGVIYQVQSHQNPNAKAWVLVTEKK